MSHKTINIKTKKRNKKEFSKEEIMELLEDYIRIDNIDDVQPNSMIRYVTLDSNKRQVFREGGRLVNTTTKSVCLCRGTFRWYVKKQHFDNIDDKEPIFETIFWKKRDYIDDLIDHVELQHSEIQILKEQLNICKELLKILKEDNKITKDHIDILKKQVGKCKEICLTLKEKMGKRSSSKSRR
jgi:hypothetical protein